MCALLEQVGLCLCRFISTYVAPNQEAHMASLHNEGSAACIHYASERTASSLRRDETKTDFRAHNVITS